MCSTLLRAMGRLSISQCTLNLAAKAPVITAVSMPPPQSSIGQNHSSRCFSKIVNDSNSSDSNFFLTPLASRFNAASIVSILGTAPTVRGKRKAFQQTCRNQRRNRKPHKRLQYGWYKNEGMYVMEKHVLVNQRALNVYPGENVGVYPNKTLYALKAGNVLTSMEELNPYPDSPLFAAVQSGERIFRLFIHVIPPPQPQQFKLVSFV